MVAYPWYYPSVIRYGSVAQHQRTWANIYSGGIRMLVRLVTNLEWERRGVSWLDFILILQWESTLLDKKRHCHHSMGEWLAKAISKRTWRVSCLLRPLYCDWLRLTVQCFTRPCIGLHHIQQIYRKPLELSITCIDVPRKTLGYPSFFEHSNRTPLTAMTLYITTS